MSFFETLGASIDNFWAFLPLSLQDAHPPITYFAIVLPITALFFQLISIITKNKIYYNAANYLFIMGTVFLVLSYFTGEINQEETRKYLSFSGQQLFDKHKTVGMLLILFYSLLLLLKIISIYVDKRPLRMFIGVLMFVSIFGIFYQVKTGTVLTYKYAAGVSIPEEDPYYEVQDPYTDKPCAVDPQPYIYEPSVVDDDW